MPTNHPAVVGIAWGTRALHAYLLDGNGVTLQRQSREVILQKLARPDIATLLNEIVASWSAAGLPIWLCGMIGSDLGWIDVPAVDCPVSLRALADAATPTTIGEHECRILPGLKCQSAFGDPERLRGEEILIAGWARELDRPGEAIMLCVPGMHGKWAHVSGNSIVRFHTAATVELFGLLRDHSFLRGELADDSFCEQSFIRGVERGSNAGNLARLLFSVRTLRLAKELTPAQTPSYAWGLLIGADLAEGLRTYGDILKRAPLVVTGAALPSRLFATAARHLGAHTIEADERALTAAGFAAAVSSRS